MNDLVRAALERLTKAIIEPEDNTNRIEMVEEALTYALTALDRPPLDDEARAKILTNLETLAIQTIIDVMDRGEMSFYHVEVSFTDDDDRMLLMSCSHPELGPLISKEVERIVAVHQSKVKEKTVVKDPKFDVN